MNVLIIAPFPPLPESSGSKMRAMTLLRSLAGHQVFLVAFCGADEPIDLAGLQKSFAEVHVFPRPKMGFAKVFLNHFSPRPLLAKRFFLRSARSRIRQLVRERQIDLVISETLIMTGYFRGMSGPYRVLDEHNLEFIRAGRRVPMTRNGFKKFYYYLIMRRMRHHEINAVNAADICLTCSEEDAMTIGRLCSPTRIVAVPNTVDSEYFRPASAARDPLRIVYIGSMWYEPNVDAMRYFCREVLPLIRQKASDVTLVIAGDEPTHEVRKLGLEKGVTVTGFLADIRPFLASASVFVAPLRMGSGTRLKILVAMAMGIPVVSTSIAAEGIAVQDGMNIRIADDSYAFADAVTCILADPAQQKKLAAGGRKLVLENYSCQAVDRQLRCVWQEIAQGLEAK